MDSSNTIATVTIQQVGESLARVCKVNPSTGQDHSLHPEASLIAELYGTMIYNRTTEIDKSLIGDLIRTALDKWLPV